MISASSLDLRRSVLDLVHDVRDILTEGNEDASVHTNSLDLNGSSVIEPLPGLETIIEELLQEDGERAISPQRLAYRLTWGEQGDRQGGTLAIAVVQASIYDILIRRQGFEKRVVSQDLQLWLLNAAATGDQSTLLARAGRQESSFTSYIPPSTTSHASANVKRLLMVRLAVQSCWVRLNSLSGSKRSLEFRCCTVAVQEAKVAS
ncbi:putative geraniol 8-hydroxylase-like [Capsicum annuum]|nr:putative geraniol 8-hydroxylase-like [Capsicum annuum]